MSGVHWHSEIVRSDTALVSTLQVSPGSPGNLYEKCVCSVFLRPPFRPGEILDITADFAGENTDVAAGGNGIFIASEVWLHPEDGDTTGSPGFRPKTLVATGAHNAGVTGLFQHVHRRGGYQFTSQENTGLYAKLHLYAASTAAVAGDTCAIHSASISVKRIRPA